MHSESCWVLCTGPDLQSCSEGDVVAVRNLNIFDTYLLNVHDTAGESKRLNDEVAMPLWVPVRIRLVQK